MDFSHCHLPQHLHQLYQHHQPVINHQQAYHSRSPSTDIIMATETLQVSDTKDEVNNKKPKRKVKFTMGPRSHCEKCKLGIKGHSSHFEDVTY